MPSQALIIHEWLTNYAGSERVVEALRDCLPGAPVATTMRCGEPFSGWDVRTSFLQPTATGPSSHIRALPLMPAAFRALRLPEADLVVTSFHTFALHARVPRPVPHLVYCHTPPRFLWRREQFGADRGRGLRIATGAVSAPLRSVDRRRARRPICFVANSRATAARLRVAYGVGSDVVHPPVDVERFASWRATPKEDYFLVVSRLVPYKRIELAIAAFNELGLPLVVAGSGRAEASLRRQAGPNVTFVGRVGDDDLPRLMAAARALVFPGEEDFGIVPVEAMAAGTPVVGLGRGGVVDSVIDGVSGVLYHEPTAVALAAAVRRFLASDWDPVVVSATVRRFAPAAFRAGIGDVISTVVSP